MRLFLPLCLCFSALFFSALGQAPQGINYQGVARDMEGKPLVSRNISVRISILKESANGEAEYVETHEVMTNSFGLFTLVIGQGSASTGSFQFVSWAIGNKWLQIELDPDGGSSFQLLGSQQLMSVPYAFYATYSGNGLSAGQGIKIQNNQIVNTGDSDNSNSNELITEVAFGSDKKLKITEAGVTKEADLSSLIGGSQNLANVLSIGNDAGNKTITNLATPSVATDAATKAYVDAHTDADASATNEIQDLNLTGNTLKITGNATASPVDLAPYLDNTDNQNLTLTGNTLSITNGNNVSLAPYLDNTDAQTLAVQPVNGDTRSITISGGNTANINVADNDNNSSNEIQNISQVLTTGNDAGGLKIANLGAPTANADAATKQYVDNLDATDLDKNSSNEIQNITQVLTTGNDAGGLKIANLGVPTANADAATKQYVDNLDATDLDKNSSNEIQNISQVLTTGNDAGGLKIANLGAPTANADAATKQYVDNLDATDLDKNSSNEIQNITQVLTTGNDAGGLKIANLGAPTVNADAATKQYVDNLDATDLDKNSSNEIQNITQVLTTGNDAGGLKIANLGAPTANADAATKQYVDNLDATDLDKNATNEIQTLTYTSATNNLAIAGGNNVTISTNLNQVLNTGADAGAHQITNLAAPTSNNDATNKNYVDVAIATAVATNYAFKATFSFVNSGGTFTDSPVALSTAFDDFIVVGASNKFTAPTSGTFMFTLTGTSTLGGIPVKIKVTSGSVTLYDVKRQSAYPLVSTINYMDSNVFKLNAGDTVEVVVTSTMTGEKVDGIFFGFKL